MKRLEDMTEPERRSLMRALGRQVTTVAELLEVEQLRYVLVVLNGTEGAEYIANCQRDDCDDIIRALCETAAHLVSKRKAETP